MGCRQQRVALLEGMRLVTATAAARYLAAVSAARLARGDGDPIDAAILELARVSNG